MSVRCLLLCCFVVACLLFAVCCLLCVYVVCCFQAYTSIFVQSILYEEGSCVCLVSDDIFRLFACFLFAN